MALIDAVPDINGTRSEAFDQANLVHEQSNNDQATVAFEDHDPDNPRNWRPSLKWSIVGSFASMSFMSVFAPAAIVPAAPQVLHSFHMHSKVYRTLLVTIWGLGEGLISPFLLAPLAERYGRLPVFHIGNLLSVGCAIGSALSVNMSMLIAFQFLTGVFLPVPIIGPAVIGDLFEAKERGFVMSVNFAAIVLADFVSPVVGSYTNQGIGWRWILWLDVIALGVVGVASLFLMRETYAERILERKAARLGKEYGRNTSSSCEPIYSWKAIQSFIQPIRILLESPIVLITSLCTATIYGLLSLVFATLTDVMEATYSISRGSIGLVFLSLAVGNLIATIFYSLTSDRYIQYQKKQKGDAFKSEARLAHLLLATLMFPFGLLLYGWTTEFHIQYIVPLVGVAIDGACLTFALLATESYLIDIFDTHGASAIAGSITLRTAFGAFLPLPGPALYNKVGLGWGNSVLALIAALLVPILLLLMRYGKWVRSKERSLQANEA